MYRLWYILGALVVWLIVFQSFFRYEYTMKNGYAVARYDRLTQKTCGIPDCLPPTPSPPTPTPAPTIFKAEIAYRELAKHFDQDAKHAVDMVKRTQFGQELMRSPGAPKFAWTCEWSDSVAGSLFTLHDPALPHALPITQKYMDSLRDPKYNVELVCFCNGAGSGYRWEVNLNTNKIFYVNDDPSLVKKYGLT